MCRLDLSSLRVLLCQPAPWCQPVQLYQPVPSYPLRRQVRLCLLALSSLQVLLCQPAPSYQQGHLGLSYHQARSCQWALANQQGQLCRLGQSIRVALVSLAGL